MALLLVMLCGCASGDKDPPETEPEPLRFFYVVHAHVSDQTLPWLNPGLTDLDVAACESMVASVAGIAAVLDGHALRVEWSLLAAGATGLDACGGRDVLLALADEGHEFSAHTHEQWDIPQAAAALETMGLSPRSSSGISARAIGVGVDDLTALVFEEIASSVAIGLDITTSNAAPNDDNAMAQLCGDVIGVGNDDWPVTHNLMYPWRPDVETLDVCVDAPDGPLLFIDHVNQDWSIGPDGVKDDDVGVASFGELQGWFDAAMDAAEADGSGRVPTWGFVTHLTEYIRGGDPTHGLDSAALDALDGFLDYVDAQVAAGRVVYATPGEIADALEGH